MNTRALVARDQVGTRLVLRNDVHVARRRHYLAFLIEHHGGVHIRLGKDLDNGPLHQRLIAHQQRIFAFTGESGDDRRRAFVLFSVRPRRHLLAVGVNQGNRQRQQSHGGCERHLELQTQPPVLLILHC